VAACNSFAWLLATWPDKAFRNGPLAVTLAKHAVYLTSVNDATALRTLAAAEAETGDFSSALTTAAQSMDLAKTQGNTALADALANQIKFYQAGTPFRQSVGK
jgi:hypothetical protein